MTEMSRRAKASMPVPTVPMVAVVAKITRQRDVPAGVRMRGSDIGYWLLPFKPGLPYQVK